MNKLQLQSVLAAKVFVNASCADADCLDELQLVEDEGNRRIRGGQVYLPNYQDSFVLPSPAPQVVNKGDLLRQMGEYFQSRFEPQSDRSIDFLSIAVRHARLADYINNRVMVE